MNDYELLGSIATPDETRALELRKVEAAEQAAKALDRLAIATSRNADANERAASLLGDISETLGRISRR